MVPMFNSQRYGDAAYGQLSRRSAAESAEIGERSPATASCASRKSSATLSTMTFFEQGAGSQLLPLDAARSGA